MNAYSNSLLLILRGTVLKPDVKVRYAKTILCVSSKNYSDAANAAIFSEMTPAAVKSAPLSDLLGRRHDYLRISLTERCNLRCQYCMPAEGVPLTPRSNLLTRDELLQLVNVFANLGVHKLRLTGGEPTLRSDLAEIIQELCNVPGIKTVSMTTNGLVLTRRLPALQRAGLSAINVSLDSLRPERYEKMSRRPLQQQLHFRIGFAGINLVLTYFNAYTKVKTKSCKWIGLSRVLAGIDLALQLGYRPVKVNTVLMRGFNDDEICDFVEFTRDREVEVRFIEFMPFSGNRWDDSVMVPHEEALNAVRKRFPKLRPAKMPKCDTAMVWQAEGHAGSVGFISSMTRPFCSTCNRLRLTADGNLKVCLFGSSEVSLLKALREGASDSELRSLIRLALRNKKPQHAESRANGESANDTDRGLAGGRRVDVDRCGTFTAGGVRRNGWTAAAEGASTPMQMAARGSALRVNDASSLMHLAAFGGSAFRVSARGFSSTVGGGASTLVTARGYCTSADGGASTLTHLDAHGRARMVDVGAKAVTTRTAEAECYVRMSARLLRLLRDARLAKGDALTVAQVAGALAAKRTADLIPLCHSLPLEVARVRVKLPKGECAHGGAARVTCEVKTTAKTGVEMEALTGAALAALTLYDMCKSVDRHMTITELRVVRKSGGTHDFDAAEIKKDQETTHQVRAHDTSPLKPDETYVPTNLSHF